MRTEILVVCIVVLTGLILYLKWPSRPVDKAKEIRATGTGGRVDRGTERPERPVPARPAPVPTKEREPRATREQIDRAKEELKTAFQNIAETASEEAKARIRDRTRFLANAGESGIATLGEVVMGEQTDSVAIALQELAAVMRLPGRDMEKSRGTTLLLRVASEHESTPVRIAAVALLGEMKIEESLQLLTEIMRTASDSELKQEAAIAIGKIGSPRAVQALLEIARIPAEAEQICAIRGLVYSRGSVAVTFLLENLSQGSDSLRAEAALALGKMGDRSLSIHLKDSFLRETSDTVIAACAKGLAALQGTSETVGWLREQMSVGKPESEKLRALTGLAGLGGQVGRDALLAVAKDEQEAESVRTAAIQKLDLPEFRDNFKENIIQFLENLSAEDQSEAVRAAASAMLEQWGVTKEPIQPEGQPEQQLQELPEEPQPEPQEE